MELWTEDRFDQAARQISLSKRTLEACRDVLVGGKTGAEVGRDRGMFPSQISRSVNKLRDVDHALLNNPVVDEVISKAEALQKAKEVIKAEMVFKAREVMGSDLVVEDPKPGHRYEGIGIVADSSFFVQKVGRKAIIHDLGRLKESPGGLDAVTIDYPRGSGLASVSKIAVDQSRGKGGVVR